MNVVGIVVEYNPFHHGHMHHLRQAKTVANDGIVIAIMSGSVVQRGEFSCVDKFRKTAWALEAGVDLVVELPGLFSLQSADLFAKTSVHLLHVLGASHLVFGSESGDVEALWKIAEAMEHPDYDEAIKAQLDKGMSYPSASASALSSLTDGNIHALPNNILGIQYLRAIRSLSSEMTPLAIQRIETGYHDALKEGTAIQSATAIREARHENRDVQNYVPRFVADDLDVLRPISLSDWYPFLRYKLISEPAEALKDHFGVEEGLEHLFKKHADAETFEDFMARILSPRYTHAKLKRTLMHILLGTNKNDLTDFTPPYVRVLGMNQRGQQYLNEIKKDIPVPLITKIERQKDRLLSHELRITEIYDLVMRENLFEKEFKPVLIV